MTDIAAAAQRVSTAHDGKTEITATPPQIVCAGSIKTTAFTIRIIPYLHPM